MMPDVFLKVKIVTFNLQEGKVSQETFDTPNLDAENLDKSRQLDLNITGWNNYKQEEVKKKPTLVFSFLVLLAV